MKDHKTISNEFTWIPIEKRNSHFGGGYMPSRKPETRKPILWLARDKNELYLVNNSEETLDYVIADSGGFQTVDDTTITTSNNEVYEYKGIKPKDAVKVEEFDGYYDLDYVLQVYLRVKSETLGSIEIRPPAEKGGIGETVLLWDSGESGKNVHIKKTD